MGQMKWFDGLIRGLHQRQIMDFFLLTVRAFELFIVVGMLRRTVAQWLALLPHS